MNLNQMIEISEAWKDRVSLQLSDGYYPDPSIIFYGYVGDKEYQVEFTIRREEPYVYETIEGRFVDTTMDDIPEGTDFTVPDVDIIRAFDIENNQISAAIRNLKDFKKAVESATDIKLGEIYVD